jgi:hypothetical protein
MRAKKNSMWLSYHIALVPHHSARFDADSSVDISDVSMGRPRSGGGGGLVDGLRGIPTGPFATYPWINHRGQEVAASVSRRPKAGTIRSHRFDQ